MKTFRKALSIILGLAIMLSCVAGMQVSVAAEEPTPTTALELKVGTATVDNGVVTVPVVVTNNPGFQTLEVTVAYDDTVLTLTGAAKNTEFVVATEPGKDVPAEVGVISPDYKKIMWAYVAEPVNATGTIATYTFAIAEGATAESTEVSIKVAQAWNGTDDIETTAIAGTVTFAKPCEHINQTTTETVTLAATCTAVGSKTVTVACSDCGEPITTTTVEIPIDVNNHTDLDSNGLCDACEGMMPTVALNPTPSFNISDKIITSYSISKSVFDSYDGFYLEFSRDKCNGQYNFEDYVEEIRLGEATEDKLLLYKGKTYYIYPSAIGMYEFSIPYSATIYAIKNGVVVARSETITRTVRQAIDEKYAALGDDRADLKALYADMIKMGGEAQRAFTSPRPNCDLAKLEYCDKGFTGTYSEKVTTFDEAAGTTNTTGLTFKASINVAETPCISYNFVPGTGYTHSDFTITASYKSNKLAVDNDGIVEETVSLTDDSKVLNYKGKGNYYYYFRSAALYDSNKDVTCTVYYQGTPIITSVDSVESCMNANITNATYTELYYAIATFSTSARVYFKTA